MNQIPGVKLPLHIEEDSYSGAMIIIEDGGGVLMCDMSNDTPDGVVAWIVQTINEAAAAEERIARLERAIKAAMFVIGVMPHSENERRLVIKDLRAVIEAPRVSSNQSEETRAS